MRSRTGVAAVVLLLGHLLGATPAWAEPTAEVIEGRMLRLVSVADWSDASSLLPGMRVQWDVAVSASTPDPGTITIAVSATGDAPLVVDAELCMRGWQEGGCPGEARILETSWNVPRDGSEIELAEFSADDIAHLRLWVALAPDRDQGEGSGERAGATDVRVHAHGAGESVVIDHEGAVLPATGASTAPWSIGAGTALALIGAGLAARRRRAMSDGGSDA